MSKRARSAVLIVAVDTAIFWSALAERSGDGAFGRRGRSTGPQVARAKAVSRFACHRTPNASRPRHRVRIGRSLRSARYSRHEGLCRGSHGRSERRWRNDSMRLSFL